MDQNVRMQDDHAEIREEVRKLCAGFPAEYWRKLDEVRGYPTEFVSALTESGYLAVLRCCMDQQLSPERLLSNFSKIPSA